MIRSSAEFSFLFFLTSEMYIQFQLEVVYLVDLKLSGYVMTVVKK